MVTRLLDRRIAAGQALAAAAPRIVDAARALADRFRRGGCLLAFGIGASAPDAHHICVEFMHPAVVGAHALPSIALTADTATITAVADHPGADQIFAHQIRALATPVDSVIAVCAGAPQPAVRAGLLAARERDLLTLALVGGAPQLDTAGLADHVMTAGASDPRVIAEVQITTYHLLWELVQLFLDRDAPARLAVAA